ncbi:UNVERIFIED_CONTAM: hypothetical protein RKD43_003225 [Streptomyces graminofaciens]
MDGCGAEAEGPASAEGAAGFGPVGCRPAAEGAGPAEAERLGEGEALPPFPSGAREESPPPACPACPSGSTCPPSGSAPVPRRSADELGAGFPPPPSSLTLIQPAEARTAREAAIQTAVRPGADNWRTGAPPVQGTRVSLPNSRHPARDTPGIPLTARAGAQGHAVRARANSSPRNTDPSPTSTEAPMFATARNRHPRSASRSVSYENVE